MVTCPSREEARKISGRLLAKRLIACASILPGVDSKFWWQDKIDSANEFLVMMKTVKANFRKIKLEVKRIHSYEIPEIIAIPIVLGSRDYLGWISQAIV